MTPFSFCLLFEYNAFKTTNSILITRLTVSYKFDIYTFIIIEKIFCYVLRILLCYCGQWLCLTSLISNIWVFLG